MSRDPAVDLKAARKQRGLTIERIADDTKIPRTLLRAVERGDFRHFPPGIYARAYSRAYAEAVGLSPDAVLAALADRLPNEESLHQIAHARKDSRSILKRVTAIFPGHTMMFMLITLASVAIFAARLFLRL